MIPPTPKPAFPNVPIARGVPRVPRQSGAASAQSGVALLINDAEAVINLFRAPQWGIYTMGGQPVLGSSSTFAQFLSAVTSGPLAQAASLFGIGGGGSDFTSSIAAFEFRQGYRIATAPQEQGAFTSYNKVQVPFDGRVTVLVGGSQAQRNAFLQTVAAMAASLTLFALVMPELVYPSVNVIDYAFRRVAMHGVSLLAVDIMAEQVRVTGTAQFSSTNTGSPSGADPANNGMAQTTDPPGGAPQTISANSPLGQALNNNPNSSVVSVGSDGGTTTYSPAFNAVPVGGDIPQTIPASSPLGQALNNNPNSVVTAVSPNGTVTTFSPIMPVK